MDSEQREYSIMGYKDISGTPVDLATEAKQDSLIAIAATESTLSDVYSEAVDIESHTADILDTQTDKSQMVQITDGTDEADVVSYEGDKSLQVAIGHKEVFSVHFDVDGAAGTVGYMLVDLSDTTNWPHTETGHIVLEQIVVDINQSAAPAFIGALEFGFLSSVAANNGDFNIIGKLHGDRGSVMQKGAFDFSLYGFDLKESQWFGPTTADDTTWQTDVDLIGPPGGAAAYPSGDGDFVMKLISSAGTIDLGITLIYCTKA